ncbi:dihydrodipicolinate synthase family protein [Gemmata sp. G18]|uniref:Dihydrodipicolinate synthase family protein n=1 Tax=Gemmata palustris TaxID=2822762 RepID=A0ABS5C3F0_9BACT|nr:dihydrodipicolinate synthase family protein [Gemmata palustris]MBP3960526.1 dihydrodipicolinate synthase family protein [Gemmata palustris]
MSVRWAGVFPAVTTQFRSDQTLDLGATGRHLETIVASGVSGLVVCGSLGENQTLDPDEKRQVVETAVRVAQGRVPVVAGVAESSTAAAVRYARDCARIGASGLMVMPPMVYKADPGEAAGYFRAVAAATDLSWMLYNNPIGYTVDVTPERLVEFADIPNLGAIKESSGDPRRVTEIRLALGDRLAIFAGVDDLILESSILGIDGWVAGSGIAFPAENQRLWELTRAGKWDEARRLYRWSAPLMKLDTHPKFVQFIKLMVQEAGLGAEWVRAPRQPLTGAERERVLGIIRHGLKSRPALSK